MKTLLFITALLITTQAKVFAHSSTKKSMNKVFENYIRLFPYIYGEKVDGMEKDLRRLERSFYQADNTDLLKSANFAPIASLFKETIAEVKGDVKNNKPHFSKHRLKRIVSLCISCHSQLPSRQYSKITNRYEGLTKKYIKTDHDKAMLAYFLRDYKSTIQHLKNEFESTAFSDEYILKTIVKIYIANLNDENGARAYLTALSGNNNVPKVVRELVNGWLDKLKTPFPYKKQKDLIRIAKDLNSQTTMPLNTIVTSSRLQRALNKILTKNPNAKNSPDILYSLGTLDHKNGQLYMYSLGDIYLKKCIINYPKSAIAKDCFKTYKDSVLFGYTGSSGTNLPEDLEKELSILQAKIKGK